MPPKGQMNKNNVKKSNKGGSNMNKTPKKNNWFFKVLLAIFGILALYGMIFSGNSSSTTTDVSYTEFISQIENVEEITIAPHGGSNNSNVYDVQAELEDGNYLVTTITGDSQLSRINDLAEQENVVISSEAKGDYTVVKTVITWGAVLVIVGLVISAISKGLSSLFAGMSGGGAGGKGGNPNDMTKSKAHLIKDSEVRLTDVAGIDDERYEIEEIIDMLKNPKRYTDAGVKIPKGVLLEGGPGCGKTLLAKAVAGEAGVPFYSVSGSDFVELYVGVGSARMRDMFAEARKNAPCIIFIDEIDAIAKKRSSAPGGGNDERESTLNSLLTEVDGAESEKGIIIMAATNRVDLLDPAVKRPGRFDRIISIPNPDTKGREAILKVHSKGKKLSEKVTFESIAKRTSGFSGAQLANVMNEAAVLMVRERAESITMRHIDEAIDRTLMGPAKVSYKMPEETRNMVAYHESGHAVLGLKLKGGVEVVNKITIIPRQDALGYVLSMPEEDSHLNTSEDLLNRIKGLLGGRIMEELKFGKFTTGASNDFMKATGIARAMVCDYGMSDLGVVQLRTTHGGALGASYEDANMSDETRKRVDEEVNKIIGRCYDEAKQVLMDNMDCVELIAKTLLDYDTITKEQIDELMEKGYLEDTKPEVEAKEEVKEETELQVAFMRKED